ncbi:hypothetical protein QJS10_CPB12g00914 [Acorus calamus]|uniref:Uncharacterized protein n=1 Tax=Acorus calamus TaxID=4465 RepID=A0AAV9DL03_ACOCL|nr:hypothetical protein QJS10_CPB12g00914 [Acorus calamus]
MTPTKSNALHLLDLLLQCTGSVTMDHLSSTEHVYAYFAHTLHSGLFHILASRPFIVVEWVRVTCMGSSVTDKEEHPVPLIKKPIESEVIPSYDPRECFKTASQPWDKKKSQANKDLEFIEPVLENGELVVPSEDSDLLEMDSHWQYSLVGQILQLGEYAKGYGRGTLANGRSAYCVTQVV